MIIVGLTWRTGEPELRLRHDREGGITEVGVRGLRLQYRATGERCCLGHSHLGPSGPEIRPCSREPIAGRRRCHRCAGAEAGFASGLHHAHHRDPALLEASMRAHLDQPNLLYLAGFRGGAVKVGTTTETRAGQRLIEQGAAQARLVARADDGVAVRQLEDLVTEVLAVPQSVSVGRKLEGLLGVGPDDDAMATSLAVLAARVGDLVKRIDDPRLHPHDQSWSSPVIGEEVWRRSHRYPHRLDEGAHDIEFVAACGRVAALRRRDDIFLADLGVLFGAVLELGDFGSAPVSVQDSLF